MRTVVDTVPRIPCNTDPATFHGMKKTIFLLFLIYLYSIMNIANSLQ